MVTTFDETIERIKGAMQTDLQAIAHERNKLKARLAELDEEQTQIETALAGLSEETNRKGDG